MFVLISLSSAVDLIDTARGVVKNQVDKMKNKSKTKETEEGDEEDEEDEDEDDDDDDDEEEEQPDVSRTKKSIGSHLLTAVNKLAKVFFLFLFLFSSS